MAAFTSTSSISSRNATSPSRNTSRSISGIGVGEVSAGRGASGSRGTMSQLAAPLAKRTAWASMRSAFSERTRSASPWLARHRSLQRHRTARLSAASRCGTFTPPPAPTTIRSTRIMGCTSSRVRKRPSSAMSTPARLRIWCSSGPLRKGQPASSPRATAVSTTPTSAPPTISVRRPAERLTGIADAAAERSEGDGLDGWGAAGAGMVFPVAAFDPHARGGRGGRCAAMVAGEGLRACQSLARTAVGQGPLGAGGATPRCGKWWERRVRP